MATRTLGLIAGFVVALATFQPVTSVETASVAVPAASTQASGNAWSVNDPHLLFVFSQMEMAMGDVNSAVELADRAASLGRVRKETAAPQPRAIDEDCPLPKQASGRS
ncbi:MAG: hypothetical protein ACRD2Y_04450 [Terriglobales bacterium]